MFSAVRHFLASCFSCMSRAVDDQPQAQAGAAHELAASTINLTIMMNEGSPSGRRRAYSELPAITSPKAPEGHPVLIPALREDVAASEQESFQNAVFVDRVLFLSDSPLKRSPAIRRREHAGSPLRESQLAVPRQELDEPTYFEIMKDSPRAARTTRVSSL